MGPSDSHIQAYSLMKESTLDRSAIIINNVEKHIGIMKLLKHMKELT